MKFRTVTYPTAKEGCMRLMLEDTSRKILKKNIEVYADVDVNTGEVKFFIPESQLGNLKEE